jgi:hypothetical protein
LHDTGKKRKKKSGEKTEEITTKRERVVELVVKDEKERACERGKKDREESERRRVGEVCENKGKGKKDIQKKRWSEWMEKKKERG